MINANGPPNPPEGGLKSGKLLFSLYKFLSPPPGGLGGRGLEVIR